MSKSSAAASGISCSLVFFWIIYLGIKVAAIPILIINVIWLVQAAQAGTVNHFDFLWLIISAATFIFL